MKISLFFIGFFSFLVLYFSPAKAYAAFNHPGLLNSRAELEFIRAKTLTNQNPWESGFNKLTAEYNCLNAAPQALSTIVANSNRADAGDRDKLEYDAIVVYNCALQYAVNGDIRYAQKAIAIMKSWSSTFNSCTGADCPLAMAYTWPAMIWGAEIIKHSNAGWSAADQASFTDLLNNKVWNYVKNGTSIGNCNWEAWMIANMYSIAVFTDSQDKFNTAKTFWDKRLPACIYASGEPQETCRDLWHTQMGLAPLTVAAEIAWHQGVDLYGSLDNRLLKGIEYTVPLVLGERPSYAPSCTMNEVGKIWPFYEMVLNHYNGRKGLSTPQTQRMVTRNRPEWFERTGWGTFTHASLPPESGGTLIPTAPVTVGPTVPIIPTPTLAPGCIASSPVWRYTPFGAQTGVFGFEFDVIPGIGAMDSVIGLSRVPAQSYADLAAIVRLNRDGFFDARNGDVYASVVEKSYIQGIKYTVRIVVNIPSRTYDVYVKNAGTNEVLLADNYAFRTELQTLTSLSNWNIYAVSGSAQYCNMRATAGPTPQPSTTGTLGTGLSLNLLLHGIGNGGDNANLQGIGNTTPNRVRRDISVELFDAANQLSATRQGIVTYNSTGGNFLGAVDFSGIGTGIYTVKISSPQYLRKTYPGIVSLTAGQVKTLSSAALVTGNTNNDTVLSILDYNIILDCYAGTGQTPRNCPETPKKLMADITDDGFVNHFDYNLFLRELSVQPGE